MGNSQLTKMQKNFIEYYIANGGIGTDAAKCAGYSEKSAQQIASQLLHHPAVKTAILERQETLENERIADIKEIKKYWTSVMRGEIIETCVNQHGKEYSQKVRVSTRLKAAEALAKSQGAFFKENIDADKKDLTIIWTDEYE